MLLAIAILTCLWEGKSLRIRNSVILAFVCYVGWVAFTIPFSIDPWISLREWQKVVAQLAVFYGTCLLVQEQDEEKFWRMMIPVIGIGTILCCSYSLLDFWERGGNIWDRNIRAGFPLSNGADFTWLSTNVLMVLPILVAGLFVIESFPVRVVLLCAACLALFGLFFSYTRGAWLGFFAQITLACWFFKRQVGYWLVGLGLLLFAIVLFFLPYSGLHQDTLDTWTIKSRLAVWEMSISDIISHPFTGVGYGVPIFERQHREHIAQLEAQETGIPDIPEKPHNWYLMVAMGAGMPGLLLFVWLLFKVCHSLWASFQSTAKEGQQWLIFGSLFMALGLSVRICFDDSFGGTHSYFFWAIVGTSLGVARNCQPDDS